MQKRSQLIFVRIIIFKNVYTKKSVALATKALVWRTLTQ